MSDLRLFADRSQEEIDAIFDAYAERDFEDLPSDIFFSLLIEAGNERPIRQIEIESTLVDDALVLRPPSDIPLPFTVQGDQIIVGDYHIRLRWAGTQATVSVA